MFYIRVIYCFFIVFGLTTFSGCAPQKPLTADEILLQEAHADCKQDADEMSDPPRNSNNRFWDSYFTMCMKTRYGYTNEQIRLIHR